MTLFLNPTEESYLRLGENKAPKYISWSSDNRSMLIRVPAAKGEYRRFELRSPDCTANPYLAFALLIWAGLDGILNNIALPEKSNATSIPLLPRICGDWKRHIVKQAMDRCCSKKEIAQSIINTYSQ